MTTVSISQTGAFQYRSADYLVGEAFCQGVDGSEALAAVVLEHVHGFSTSTDVCWLQIFAGGTTPGAGDIPLVSIRIEAEAEFSWMAPQGGYRVAGPGEFVGSWWVSSTGNEYTASAETFWVNAQGRAIKFEE